MLRTIVLDLGGTFAFVLSGAMAGVRRRFDIFGCSMRPVWRFSPSRDRKKRWLTG
ncbi:TRIC cation channel family protein [Novosphingobium sp. 18050]|uniref:TRIC cation channel family protein n=1 Tax=unclassified Novosphingobium TaxID=2644732 RepID=UPI0034CEEA36